ncbi:MAG: gliding motility-associated C-terminal domain-containing protein, partial [Candidatus Zixiibacteriota bacterium]
LNFSIPLSSIDVDSISIGVYAETTEGIETSPINWICHIDRDAPIIEPLTSAIESPDQDIKFLLQDPKSGLNYSSLEISMANTHGSFPLAPEVIADTAIVCIADIPITGCDDVIFNVSIMDNSNLCGHNLKNFFDTLSTPCSYPVIEPEPLSSMYLCDDEIVLKYQISDDEGINIEDAEISIGSRLYDIDDESMVFMRDTLQLTVDLLAFDDGEYEIVLTGVKDIFENTSPDISSSIKIDNRSPEIVTVSPPLEEEIRERDATLNISFADEHSGINYSRSEITIPALGRSFTLDSGDIDISLSELDISGLEELELCCHIFDNAEGCGGNSIDSCFSYNLNFDGPLLEVLTPNTDGIWACSDSFAFSIIDPDGIDESSISIFYQSETYSMDEPEVSLTGHILTFTPEHIPEAEEISLALIASDIHGNSSDSNWEFEFDFTGPIIEIISPSDGIVTHDFRKEFRAIITDNFSGVSAASFEMVLNGTIYDISSPEISIYGDTLIYQPSENYLSSNNMNLHISDLADFCPNTTELSLAFEAIPEPLVIETLQPENEISTGCEFTEFSIEYSSPESLIVETAQILINGEESSQELEISDGIISFEIQSSDFNQGLNRVDVFALADRFSNIYSDTISFSIFYDSSAPEVEYISHNSGMDIPESTSVKILFEDRSGVSKESAVIVSNLSDFDFIWLADTLSLRINDFETDTAEIEISIFDSLDLCPNQAHIVLSYPIEHPEFFIDVLEPHDGSISHMPGQRVLIHARGRNINSAELLINGEALTEEELIFDPISERFTFMPDAEFWQEGQNHLTFSIDENSSFWSFTYDVSPPEVVSLSPSADSHIEDIPELISIDVEDRYSGIDSEMFEITIEDVIIPIGNYSFQNNRFDITIPDLERNFEPGDSVEVRILNLQDNEPDYGYPNSIENELQYYYIYDGNGWIISEKYIFTPNGDGHNDEIIIKTSRESKAKIYNMNGREIKTLAGKGELIWDGKDLNGKDATPGLYMYLIEQEGQIKGKGTIVIAR